MYNWTMHLTGNVKVHQDQYYKWLDTNLLIYRELRTFTTLHTQELLCRRVDQPYDVKENELQYKVNVITPSAQEL